MKDALKGISKICLLVVTLFMVNTINAQTPEVTVTYSRDVIYAGESVDVTFECQDEDWTIESVSDYETGEILSFTNGNTSLYSLKSKWTITLFGYEIGFFYKTVTVIVKNKDGETKRVEKTIVFEIIAR